MSCNCQCNESGVRDVTLAFPEKTKELISYLDSLPPAAPGRERGYLIQSLHRAQHIFGFLPAEVQQLVAEKLGLQPAEVYGVISFYSYFTDKPVGRYKINVCAGTACFVKGSAKILEEFKRYLNIEEGESTPDGKFFLGALRCVGACSLAPVVMVNDRVYGKVTTQMVPEILNDCAD